MSSTPHVRSPFRRAVTAFLAVVFYSLPVQSASISFYSYQDSVTYKDTQLCETEVIYRIDYVVENVCYVPPTGLIEMGAYKFTGASPTGGSVARFNAWDSSEDCEDSGTKRNPNRKPLDISYEICVIWIYEQNTTVNALSLEWVRKEFMLLESTSAQTASQASRTTSLEPTMASSLDSTSSTSSESSFSSEPVSSQTARFLSSGSLSTTAHSLDSTASSRSPKPVSPIIAPPQRKEQPQRLLSALSSAGLVIIVLSATLVYISGRRPSKSQHNLGIQERQEDQHQQTFLT